MAKAKFKSPKVTTPRFRASFPAIISPSQMKDEKGVPTSPLRYSVVMLFDSAAQATPEFKAMQELAHQAAVFEFGPDYKKKVPNFKSPFHDGNQKDTEKYPNYKDMVHATAVRYPVIGPPGVITGSKERVDLASEKAGELIYAGRYMRATVSALAYDKAGNKGVSFYLQNIQLLSGGEPFNGSRDPVADFDEVIDPMEHDDDEVSF